MFQRFKRRKEEKLLAEQQAEQHRQAIAELRQLTHDLPDSDGVIQVDGLRRFIEFADAHQIDYDEVSDLLSDVRFGLAQGGLFIKTETALLLKRDEVFIFEASVALLKEVADREFRGGSQGLSIPLGQGFRYRVGAFRGQMVTVGTRWEDADTGPLSVTSHRVVFSGARRTLEFPFAKLVNLSVFSDAIALGVTSRQATSTFRTADPELIAGMIHAAINHPDDEPIKFIQLEPAQ